MKVKENCIVINGIRYDAVKDSGSFACLECALYAKCIDSNGCFCRDLFSASYHFKVNLS